MRQKYGLSRVTGAMSTVIAALTYLLARATGQRRLLDAAERMDHLNFRPVLKKTPSQHSTLRLLAAAHLAAAASAEDSHLVIQYLSHSKSQILQDLFAVLASKGKKSGTFVEVGVGSGVHLSNSFLLEAALGWEGVLVEPNRASHDSILAHRKARLETRAAASRSGQEIDFEEMVHRGEFSRVAGTVSHDLSQDEIKRYTVKTVTMTEICEMNQLPNYIDFLSLDTEGSELDILEGIDFDRYTFGAMAIEHNHHQEARAKMREILAPHGYRQVLQHLSDFDAWFVHNSNLNQFDAV